MSNITPSTPYLAPGAPKSPILLAVAGLLVAVASALASRLGFVLPTDALTTTAVAGVLAGLVGYVQHRLARGEQVVGAARLDATLVQALGQTPPAPEAILGALERLRPRAASFIPTTTGMPRVTPWPAPPARRTIPPWEDAVGESLRPPTAAEQLHALDPAKRPGLDAWSGVALRRILEGEEWGVVGPIIWEPGTAPGSIRVDVDGTTRMAKVGDERSIARALGAELWLEASKNADAPAPRPRVPSNALLDDAGEPVSAGDLDSGEISEGPDLDERQAWRIEAEISARRKLSPEDAAAFVDEQQRLAEQQKANTGDVGGSWLSVGLIRRKNAERLLEEIVGAREAHGIYAAIWKSLTGEDLPPLDDADPDERTTERVETDA